MSRRTAVSPAENHLMTWKRSSTWRAWPRWASMAGLVGLGAVADDDFDSLAPSVALLHQKR